MRAFTTLYIDPQDRIRPGAADGTSFVVESQSHVPGAGDHSTLYVQLPQEPVARVNSCDDLIEVLQNLRRRALIEAGVDPDHLHAGGQHDTPVRS